MLRKYFVVSNNCELFDIQFARARARETLIKKHNETLMRSVRMAVACEIEPPIRAAFIYNLTYINWQFGDNLVPRVDPQTGYPRYVGRRTSRAREAQR